MASKKVEKTLSQRGATDGLMSVRKFPIDRHEPPLGGEHVEGIVADTADTALGTRLMFSAQAVEKQREDLSAKTAILRNAMAGRVSGEARLIAQGIRLIIGVIWLLVALALIFGAGENGSLSIPVVDAKGLAQLFLFASAPACLLAIVAIAYVFQSTGSNRRVRQAAENVGLHIAGVAREFNAVLSKQIGAVHREDQPGQAVESLAHAHITALEAQLFFRQLKFLHADHRADALMELKRFLKGGRVRQPPAGLVFIVGLITGIMLPIMAGALLSGSPEPTGPIPDIFRYPAYFNILFFGGLIYVFIGAIMDSLPAFGDVRRRAMEDALDSLRGAYTADNAPRFGEVIRRVEDSLTAFQAHLDSLRTTAERNRRDAKGNNLPGERHTLATHSNASVTAAQADGQHEASLKDSDLSWRHRDSTARFVNPGFQSAPHPWRREQDLSKSDPARPKKS